MSATSEERFWAKVVKTDTCWLWIGARTNAGYGTVSRAGKRLLAHRVVYEQSVESIPQGYVIDHLCENKSCVNPAHLEAVSQSANSDRYHGQRTICRRGHPLDGLMRNGDRCVRRYCKTCDRDRKRARRVERALLGDTVGRR